MKTAFILATVAASATAFAPSSLKAVKTSSLSMSEAPVEPVEPPKPAYPTLNGWTTDPKAFCAGLPGSVAPLGQFDPVSYTPLTLPPPHSL